MDDDCFAQLEQGFKFYSLTENVDGVLGQTYTEGYVSRVKMSANNPIVGGDDKFSASELFAPDCAMSRFGLAGSGIAMVSELSTVNCAGGIGGLLCKK